MTNFLFITILFFSNMSLAVEKSASKCPSGEHWVRAHHRSAYVRFDGVAVSAAYVRAHCSSNPPSYSFWKPLIKNGLPKDWLRKEVPSVWTDDEIEFIIEALSDLPTILWNKQLHGIFRAKKSIDYPNPASSFPNNIVIYDSAFNENRNLARVLAHELAHQLYQELAENMRKGYWTATNWFKFSLNEAKPIYTRRDDGFVELDGKNSPDEDYANNIEYFLFEPEKLKRITPNAYNWIKNHFGDTFKLGKGDLHNGK